MTHYRTTLRPVGFATLPPGTRWEFVEAPAMHGLANRPDLPTSLYRYGVFSTATPIAPADLQHFDIVKVAP